MLDETKKTSQERQEREHGHGGGGGESLSRIIKTWGITLLLTILPVLIAFPSVIYPKYFAQKPAASVSINGSVCAETLKHHKRYYAPATIQVIDLPEKINVKPVAAGSSYTLSMAEQIYAGSVMPGEVDHYMVYRASDGNIYLVSLDEPASANKPTLGGN